jgi:hypothetical protein
MTNTEPFNVFRKCKDEVEGKCPCFFILGVNNSICAIDNADWLDGCIPEQTILVANNHECKIDREN